MDKTILSFIDSQKNLTFCTATDNVPYCANCFYAFVPETYFLVFKSGSKNKHIIGALNNENVAGTILPDISKTGTIKGIQFAGRFIIPENDLLEKAQKNNNKKYPFAPLVPSELWAVELTSVKMTDNTLGFGKKLIWQKSTSEEV